MIDISVPIHQGLPVWPDGAMIEIYRIADMDKGSICNVSQLGMTTHMGTHIDAPLHFINGAKPTSSIPLDRLVGDCYVAEIKGKPFITASDLAMANIPAGTQKLLLKTDNSRLWENYSHSFYEDFCALKNNAAEWIIDFGIHLIGIDYLSIAPFHDPPEIVHRTLLQAEVVILETIDLRFVDPGLYELICLPLKIANVDGNPSRAVLRKK